MASSELTYDDGDFVQKLRPEIPGSCSAEDEQDLHPDHGTRSHLSSSTPMVFPRPSPVEAQWDGNQMSSRFNRIKDLLSLNPSSKPGVRDFSSFIGGAAQHAFPRHILATVTQGSVRREVDLLEQEVRHFLEAHERESQDTQRSLTESKEQVSRLEKSVEDLQSSLRKACEDITREEEARRCSDARATHLETQTSEIKQSHEEELSEVRSEHEEQVHSLHQELEAMRFDHGNKVESINAWQQRQKEEFETKLGENASAHRADIESMKDEHQRQMEAAREAELKIRSEKEDQAEKIRRLGNIVRSRKESLKWLRNTRQGLLQEKESLEFQIEQLKSAHAKTAESLKANHERELRSIQTTLSDANRDREVVVNCLEQRFDVLQAKCVEEEESFAVQKTALETQIAELRSKHDKELSSALTAHESDASNLETRFQALRSDSARDKKTIRSELESIKLLHHNALKDMEHQLANVNSIYTAEMASLREKLETDKHRLEAKAVEIVKAKPKTLDILEKSSQDIKIPEDNHQKDTDDPRSRFEQQRRSVRGIPQEPGQNQESQSRDLNQKEQPLTGNSRGVYLKPINTIAANTISWAEQQRLMDSDESKSPKSAGHIRTPSSRHSWHSNSALSGTGSPDNSRWQRLASCFTRTNSERHRRSQESGGVALGHSPTGSENNTQAAAGQTEEGAGVSSEISKSADKGSPKLESSILRLRLGPREREHMRFGGRGTSRSGKRFLESSTELDQAKKTNAPFKQSVQPQPVVPSDNQGLTQRRPATSGPGFPTTNGEAKYRWKGRREKSRSLAERQSHAMLEAGKSSTRARLSANWV